MQKPKRYKSHPKIKSISSSPSLYIIALVVLIILAFCIRLWDNGGLSGGDDSGYAMWTFEALEQKPFGLLYLSIPDEPIIYRLCSFSRPMAVIPLALSVSLFGFTTFALKLPALLFSSFSVLLLYLILKRFYDEKFVLTTCTLFAFLPLYVAFTRTAFLEGQLVFLLLMSFYFYIRAIDEEKLFFFFIGGFFVLLNMLSTDFRGVAPLIAVLPYLFFSRYRIFSRYKNKKKNIIRYLFYDKLFLAFIFSSLFFLAVYIFYLLVPVLFFNDSRILEHMSSMLSTLAVTEKAGFSSIGAAKVLAKLLFMTPFLGFVLVPSLFGLYFCLKKITKPINVFWVVWLFSSVYYFFQGQPSPVRSVIFTPVYCILCCIGLFSSYKLFMKHKKSLSISLLFFLTASSYILLLRLFPITFPAESKSLVDLLFFYGLDNLYYSFMSFYWIGFIIVLILALPIFYYGRLNIKIKNIGSYRGHIKSSIKVFVVLFILMVILTNIAVSVLVIKNRVGVYYREDSITKIGNYLNKNLADEKYSCVAGIHSKTLTYLTQRYCVYWRNVTLDWLETNSRLGNVKYFIVNLYYLDGTTVGLGMFNPDGTLDLTNNRTGLWYKNYPDKYMWMMNNTIDITTETGLSADNPYFRLRRFNAGNYSEDIINNDLQFFFS